LEKIGNCSPELVLSNTCLQDKVPGALEGALYKAITPFIVAWSQIWSYLLWRFPQGSAWDAIHYEGNSIEQELDEVKMLNAPRKFR